MGISFRNKGKLGKPKRPRQTPRPELPTAGNRGGKRPQPRAEERPRAGGGGGRAGRCGAPRFGSTDRPRCRRPGCRGHGPAYGSAGRGGPGTGRRGSRRPPEEAEAQPRAQAASSVAPRPLLPEAAPARARFPGLAATAATAAAGNEADGRGS